MSFMRWSHRRCQLLALTAFISLGSLTLPSSHARSARGKRQPPAHQTLVTTVVPTRLPVPMPTLTAFRSMALTQPTATPLGRRKIVSVASSLPRRGLTPALVERLLPTVGTTPSFSLIGNPSAMDAATNRIEVPVGMFVTLTRTTDIRSVAVADEKVADVAVLSPRAVLINGKSPGVTSLVLQADKGAVQQFEVRVVAPPSNTLDEIRQHLNVPGVQLALVRGTLVLEGEVDSEAHKKKALAIAQLFSQNVVDLLTVRSVKAEPVPKPEDVITSIQRELALPDVTVRMVEGKVVLSGQVELTEDRVRAEGVAKLYARGEVVNLITLRPYSAEELQQAIASPTIQVRVLRDAVFLEGTVDSQAEATQIEEFVRKRAGGKDVMNRLRVVAAPAEPATPRLTFAEQVQQAIGMPTVKVSGSQNGLVLEGSVENDQQLQKVLAVVQMFIPDAQKVKSFVAVRSPDQVRVEVAVVEINLNRLREFGVSYPREFTFGENTTDDPIRRQTPFSFTVKVPPNLRQDVKVLSKPNTIVLSGKQAKFQVGGEVPIPSASTSTAGQTIASAVEYRPFGIVLTVTPTVNVLGDIHLKITTEVSELGPTFLVAVGPGTSEVPSFLTRNSDTEVYLKDGHTLVLGGLIEHRDEKTVNKFPFLGSIPVLGELFTSRSFQRKETELVVFVTPRVVRIEESG
ncbi:MAG: BON domain-containing protein [Abditibacteriales bacterium]|nr:BON domain-containing protein [Abditibacteriales bacterium]MDW8368159.1 BON domain-containing protein [Abditibacteriales bacterium]